MSIKNHLFISLKYNLAIGELREESYRLYRWKTQISSHDSQLDTLQSTHCTHPSSLTMFFNSFIDSHLSFSLYINRRSEHVCMKGQLPFKNEWHTARQKNKQIIIYYDRHTVILHAYLWLWVIRLHDIFF